MIEIIKAENETGCIIYIPYMKFLQVGVMIGEGDYKEYDGDYVLQVGSPTSPKILNLNHKIVFHATDFLFNNGFLKVRLLQPYEKILLQIWNEE